MLTFQGRLLQLSWRYKNVKNYFPKGAALLSQLILREIEFKGYVTSTCRDYATSTITPYCPYETPTLYYGQQKMC